MTITIDQEGCICCGLCAESCPAVFQMSEAGPAEVYAQPAPAQQDCARFAAENCPALVIHVAD